MPLALILSNWRLILEVVVVGVLLAYVGMLRLERDHIKAEYAEYRTNVAKAAQAAAEAALQKTIADEKRKEEADAENLRLHADLDAAARKLRDARRNSSFVPPAPSCPERPASACFDRAILERALRDLDSEVQGLVDEGDRAIVDLETAKKWAQQH